MWVTARKERQNLLSGQPSPALRGPSAPAAAVGLAGKPTGVLQEGAPCKGSVSLRLEPWGQGPLSTLSSQAARGAVPEEASFPRGDALPGLPCAWAVSSAASLVRLGLLTECGAPGQKHPPDAGTRVGSRGTGCNGRFDLQSRPKYRWTNGFSQDIERQGYVGPS